MPDERPKQAISLHLAYKETLSWLYFSESLPARGTSEICRPALPTTHFSPLTEITWFNGPVEELMDNQL